MSDKLSSAVKTIEDEMTSIKDVAKEIKNLGETVIDSNEELISTFVEGTKRLINKKNESVSPDIKQLTATVTAGFGIVADKTKSVEKAVKELKMPSDSVFRESAAILKRPIKELTRSIGDFKTPELVFPKSAKDAIPVRLSDGEKFYKALDQVIQQISGGATSYAFENSHKSPRKALVDDDGNVQVDVVSMPAVSIDTTGLATEYKQDDIITALGTGVTVTGTVTANLSATDNAVLDQIELNQDAQTALLTTIDTSTGAMVTDLAAIEVLLTTIESNQLADGHNVTVDNASIAVTGTFWQATQPVSIAGTVAVDLGANNDVTVTGTVDLGATDNAVLDDIAAKLATIDTDTGNIVTAVQLIDNAISGAGFNITQFAGAAVPIGAGTEAAALRVTVATDSTGVLSIDDNGGTITVDGTVTANLSATDNAVLDNIDTDLTTIIGHVDGIEGYVDGIETLLGTIDTDTGNIATSLGNLDNAVDGNYLNVNLNIAGTDVAANAGVLTAQTLRVTIATDDEVNNLLGTIDADTGNIVTAVQIMDDWDNGASNGASVSGDVAHDAADAGEPVKIGGKAQEPTAALEEVADNDRVNGAFDRQGRLAVWNGYPVQSAVINNSTNGNNTIQAAAGAGKRIAVMGYHIVSDGTTDFRWEDGAGGTAFTGQIPLQAREGVVAGYGFSPMWVGTANTLLNLELTAAVNVHGQVSFVVMED